MLNIELGKISFGVRSPLKRWVLGLIVLVVGAFVLMPAPHRAATSVTLDYFKAEWKDAFGTVFISWKTATELDTLGFIVQRSTSPGGPYVEITKMIPARGDQLTGGEYGVPPFDDNNPPIVDDSGDLILGTTYWYQLVVINSNPPNGYIPPVAVLAGTEDTVTPTPTMTRTPTRTPTPSGTSVPVSLSIMPAMSQLPATVGQSVTQTLRLTNIGNITCQIYLFHNSHTYSVVVSPVSVELAEDTGIDVSVRVFVPAAPTVYSNTVDVIALVYGADPPFVAARVIIIVWLKTYLPVVIHH